jgi:hypothetical protein
MSISFVNGDPVEIAPFGDPKLKNFFLWDGVEGKNSPERGLGIVMVFHLPPGGDSVPENY